MREILTQEEVDALLEAYDSGEIEGGQPPSAASTPFDFLSHKLIGGVQETLIELIQNNAAKGCSVHLTGVTRREIKVSNASSYTETAGNFLSNFKGRSCIGVLSSDLTPGHMFLAMSPFLAYALVDLMLGGDGRIAEPDDRDFSVLEVRMAGKVMAGLTAELSKAWNGVSTGHFSLVKVETNPKMLPAVPDQDPIYVMNFRVESDTGLSRDFTVSLPFGLIESLKGQAEEPEPVDPMASEYAALLRESAEEIVLTVEVMLGEVSLPIREILSLKPGDVITTDQEIDAPVAVLVEGKPKLSGRPGISRGNRAIKITAG
ncbi:MAG TPA: FliM/FliN family flagellar motor switch protein [Candidatus Deferrimicrobiaceae bacterium]